MQPLAKSTQNLTFDELFSLYYERHVKLRTRCPRNTLYFLTAHGAYWKEIPLEEITRELIQDWADGVALKSPSAATRGIGVLSAMFNWGIKRGHFKGVNPCIGVEKFRTKSRKRFLTPEELVRFCDALTKEPPLIHDFFLTCLTTAARRGNVQAMRWEEIDFDLETWTIPEENFKNGESHILPLNKMALAILKSRAEKSSGSPWVFPTRRSSSGHLMEPRRALERILERANIQDFHIHDLRRTHASYMAIHGENQYVIGQMLGHRDMRSTAIYARLNMTAVRNASETVINKWQTILATDAEAELPNYNRRFPRSRNNKQHTTIGM